MPIPPEIIAAMLAAIETAKHRLNDTTESVSQIFNSEGRAMFGNCLLTSAIITDGLTEIAMDSVLIFPDVPLRDGRVAIEDVLAVFECVDDLTRATLHASLEKIASVKSLKRTRYRPDPDPNCCLSVILSRGCSIALEDLGADFDTFALTVPSNLWADMVAVHNVGTISFSVQYPGGQPNGQLILPDLGRMGYSPPISAVRIVSPTQAMTLNHVMSFVAMRAGGSKAIGPFDPDLLLNGATRMAVTATVYQFDLSGLLRPPKSDKSALVFNPQKAFVIKTTDGTPLAGVNFVPWQDGGVILMQGQFPLQGLLVFLPIIKPEINREGMMTVSPVNGLQCSNVLPINRGQFLALLSRFQRQTRNIVVEEEPGTFILQKISDEGAGSPFVARLMAGMFKVRDLVYTEGIERDGFDRQYELVRNSADAVRQATTAITDLLKSHLADISSGNGVQVDGRAVHISTEIDRELRRDFESFLNTSARALKTQMQQLASLLGGDIGFLFKKSASFERGIETLRLSSPDLADYLLAARAWTEPLLELRNLGVEHGTWSLPKVGYAVTGTAVQATEPEVLGMTTTEYCTITCDRLMLFIEEVTVHLLQAKMRAPLSISEIPLSGRDAALPERFTLTIDYVRMPVWRIMPSSNPFSET